MTSIDTPLQQIHRVILLREDLLSEADFFESQSSVLLSREDPVNHLMPLDVRFL